MVYSAPLRQRTALPMAAILVADASAYDLGFLAVALSLPGVLVAWVAGGWVDRHRRRPLLIATDLIRAAALLAIPLAALRHVLSLPLLYAVAAVTGICTVLFNLADHVFITGLVSRKRLLDANGKREAADAIAEISGPAIGGALVAPWVLSLPLLVYRVAMLVWALWLAFAVIRWSRWAWSCFSAGGVWRPLRSPKVSAS